MLRGFLGTILLSILLVQTSCERMFFEDLSDITKQVYDDIQFKELKVKSGFNIVLKQDSIYRVVIETPREFQENILVSIDTDTLIIEDKNSKKWVASYLPSTVIVHFPTISRVKLVSPSNIDTEGTITQSSFRILSTNHSGTVNLNLDVNSLSIITGFTFDTGIYNLYGKANSAYVWARNVVSVNALNLEIGSARIVNNSLAD